MDVSVIIASYNVAGYIARAIESALTQAGVTLEVVVVDDASTDGTWEIIQKISDSRVKAIRLETNSGPGAARNQAMAVAQGAWLAVLDGDDQWLPGRLARLLALATKESADVVVDNLRVLREADGAEFPMFVPARLQKMHRLTLEDFIVGNLRLAAGYGLGYFKPVWRAEFLRQHSLTYPEKVRIGEDYGLMFEALASGAVCAVEPSEGYGYTARAGSVSYRLTLADIARMEEEDARLAGRYVLSSAAQRYYQRRQLCRREAYAYQAMIDALKAGDVLAFVKAIAGQPLAARYLYLPLYSRLRKVVTRLRPFGANAVSADQGSGGDA